MINLHVKISRDIMTNRTITLVLLLLSFELSHASASTTDQVGILTQVQGTVKLFTHPSKTLQKTESSNPHALFEGEYYLVEDAKPGSQLDQGNIIRTAPGSKARVVYKNGDQFNVASATAYRVSWDTQTNENQTRINLTYGKIRGIIEKGGPRSHLQIRTRSAVMGVRGTDFFIAENGGAEGSTEITILRGAVEVTPQRKAQSQKPIQVKAGYSAQISTPSARALAEDKPILKNPPVEIRKTTQEEFAGIKKSSTLGSLQSAKEPNLKVQKDIESLEQKAKATALNDIKTYDKKLYAQLQKQENQIKTVDDLNQAEIGELSLKAPKAPSKHKPYQSEIEDSSDGAYEKYFKNID